MATPAPSYDITNGYDWTSIPHNNKYREEAPSAYVTAYELEYGQLQQFIDGYINIATSATEASLNPGEDPGMIFYRNLYKSAKPKANFNFPFFSDDIRSFTTEFTDSFSKISQRGAKFVGAKKIMGFGEMGESLIGGGIAAGRELANMGGNAVSDKIGEYANLGSEKISKGFEDLTGLKMPGLQTVGAPGSYIETPQFYQYSNTDSALEINFVLSNTINKEGYEQNQSFITEFTKMNRPKRLGPIGVTFPAIYHIEVPGLRYIEWAFLNSFNIGLLGTRRKIGNKILPEAFRCQFSFRSLTVEAANFMDQVDNIGPYDDSDTGYLTLRNRADEARKKSLKDQKKAAAESKAAREKAAEDKRIEDAKAAAVGHAAEEKAQDAAAAAAAKKRQLEEGERNLDSKSPAERAKILDAAIDVSNNINRPQ